MRHRWLFGLCFFSIGLACSSADTDIPANPDASADAPSDRPSVPLDTRTDADAPTESAVDSGAEHDVAILGDASDATEANLGDASDATEGPDRSDATDAGDSTAEAEAGGDAADSGDGPEAGPMCLGWTPWIDGLAGGAVTGVQFDPRTPGLALALAGGRLYQSQDSGQSWTVLSENGGGLGQIAFPPNAPGVLLGAASDGFRRSIDSGKTWQLVSLSGLGVGTLLIDPAKPERLFAGGDQGFLMRSTDQGTTWRSASAGIPFGQIMGFGGDPADLDHVLAAVTIEDTNGAWTDAGVVLQTTDGGASWRSVVTGIGRVTAIAQCAADPKVIFVSTTTGLSKSTDLGAHWTTQLAGQPLTSVAVTGSDCLQVYAGEFSPGMVRSIDGGDHWSGPLTSGMTIQRDFQYPDQIAVDPSNPANVVASTHDGLFRSSNAGDLWSASTGLANVATADLAVSPLDPGHLWLASWGSGLWHRPTPASAWQRVSSSQFPRDWALGVYPDGAASGRILAGGWLGGGDAWQSTDNGATFAGPTAGALNPFVFQTDPSNTAVIYMGTQLGSVRKSIDNGQTWPASNTGAESVSVRSILIDPDDSRNLYIGTEANGIYRSTDAGASWHAVMMVSSAGRVASLIKTRGQSPMLFAWVNGVGVYRSSDGEAWTPSNQGISSFNAGGMVYDADASALFVDSGSALYQSSDGISWKQFDSACPPPPVLGGKPVIVKSAGMRFIVVNGYTSKSGVFAHVF